MKMLMVVVTELKTRMALSLCVVKTVLIKVLVAAKSVMKMRRVVHTVSTKALKSFN